jgi:hypothetical protein
MNITLRSAITLYFSSIKDALQLIHALFLISVENLSPHTLSAKVWLHPWSLVKALRSAMNV